MVKLGQKWLYRGKWLYLGKEVLFEHKRLYSDKSCCTRAKVDVFRLSSCIRESDCIATKVVVFGKKWLYLGNGGCIRAKVVVFGQGGLVRAKLVVFG